MTVRGWLTTEPLLTSRAAVYLQPRMMASVIATSTAAAAAAQTNSVGRRPFGALPSRRPHAVQVAASPARAAPQSPQRISTRSGQRDDVVGAAGHLSNQLRM